MLGALLGSVCKVSFNFCNHHFQTFYFKVTIHREITQDMVPRSTVFFTQIPDSHMGYHSVQFDRVNNSLFRPRV